MHAIPFTETKIFTISTFIFFHPFSVTVRFESMIPYFHKIILINISLVIIGTNTTYLSNAVNNYFGCNFKRLINSYRVVRAKELLDGKDCPVNELFSRCGFASKSVFYVAFRKVVGMTPLQYICLLYTSPSPRD